MIEAQTGVEPRSAGPDITGLATRCLGVRFGDRLVLDDVSVRLNPGEVVGIAGPNGSGKTTLLRAMAGLIRPETGAIQLGSTELSDVSPGERARHIGYMPQSAGDHSFTALEFVLMGRYPHLSRFRLEGRSDHRIAQEAMERTGTLEFADRRLQTLSGGERQRVALARLLAQQADVLLLDEPTANLDMQHQLLTMATAREEADNGATVAVVMHDLSLAARHCDRLILLNRGRVIAEGDPWKVVTQANLRDIFSVDAAVEPEPLSRRPMISVLGISDREKQDRKPQVKRIHIVCGAGSGRDLMHRLALDGHVVSACVLGAGDADGETAERLDIEYVSSPPFSVITLEQDAAHRKLVREADVVIVCEMAVGPGNLRNLEAASEARRLLLIARPADARWDYTDGYAARVYDELLERGETVERADIQETIRQFASQ